MSGLQTTDVASAKGVRNVLADNLRCPAELCPVAVAEGLSEKAGYFRFGKDAVCYGRAKGTPAESVSGDLHDVIDDVRFEGSFPTLPFDPAEVIDNLTHERYVNRTRSAKEKALYAGYYLLRPLMPVWFRRHLQKARIQSTRNKAFPQWPMDCTVERILETALTLSMKGQQRESVPFIWYWPNAAPSCAIITHDVETTTGLRFCPELMNIEDSFGMKSSFQLVPEKRYSLSNQIVDEFKGKGFEVNIHDLNHDGHLYSEREEFLRRVKKINEYGRKYGARGFRSGALHRNLNWYDALEFDYDMSVPNAGHLEAQVGGCCTIRPYFINQMVELPLTTTQDYSLFHILGEYSTDMWKQQIDRLIEKNGLVSFIVHPDYVIDKKAQDVYRSLLAYLAELRADGKLQIALPGEVATWWRQRNGMQLVGQGDSWYIQGAGRERASVAYAHCDGGDMTYQMAAQLERQS